MHEEATEGCVISIYALQTKQHPEKLFLKTKIRNNKQPYPKKYLYRIRHMVWAAQ